MSEATAETAPSSKRRIYILTSFLLFLGLTALKMDTIDVQLAFQLYGNKINSLRGASDTISTSHPLINVAKGKSASQSSTYSSQTADYAIDGDLTTFSHTDASDSNAWIEIDLQHSYYVHSIHLLNRWCFDPKSYVEGCRCKTARLSLIDGNGGVIESRDVWGTCTSGEFVEVFDADCIFENLPSTSSACLPSVQKIKIESMAGDSIQLFELQVFSPGKDTAHSELDSFAKSLINNADISGTTLPGGDVDTGFSEIETLAADLSEIETIPSVSTPAKDAESLLSSVDSPADSNVSLRDNDTAINSSKQEVKPNQDYKCKHMFEWSMMDEWQSDRRDFDLNNLPQTKKLSIDRMGGPSADGTLCMTITVHKPQLKMLVVDLTENMKDLYSSNMWHHHTVLYGTWVGVQIAQRKYNLITDRVVYVHDCRKGELPTEWRNLGELSCDRNLINQADVVLIPPIDGLMWDLAWDLGFTCYDSEMFKAYSALFVDRTSKLEPTEALGCWISRQGYPERVTANLDDVLEMMREVFPRAEEIVFSPDKTANQTVEMIQDCRVLIGVHGAGHTNAVYARPGVTVIEAIGKIKPAYFRNINMLLNQNYQTIVGDRTKDMSDTDWIIDLKEARAALEEGRDNAAEYIKEHGHWRL